MEKSDRELWLRLGDFADAESFLELFRRHSDPVYNACRRRLTSWPQAEAATRAVFTGLWHQALNGRIIPLRTDSARPTMLALARDECAALAPQHPASRTERAVPDASERRLPDPGGMLQTILQSAPAAPGAPRSRPVVLAVPAVAFSVAAVCVAGLVLWGGGNGALQISRSQPAAGIAGAGSDATVDGGRLPIGRTARVHALRVTVLEIRRDGGLYGVRARSCVAGPTTGPIQVDRADWRLRLQPRPDGADRDVRAASGAPFGAAYPDTKRLAGGACADGWISFRIGAAGVPEAIGYTDRGVTISWRS